MASSTHFLFEVICCFWLNLGGMTALVQFLAEPIGVKCLGGQQGIKVKAVDHRLDADHVKALVGQEHEANKTPQSVDQGNDLGGQASS